MSSVLAIGAAAALAAAAHLRARAAGRAGSRVVANVGTISDEDLRSQLHEGVSDREIVLLWPTDDSGWVYTLQDLKDSETWFDDVEPELVFQHLRQLVREAGDFFNGIRFPLRLYRGLLVRGGRGHIRPDLGRHWSIDPAVAREFALGEHEGSGHQRIESDRPFVASMILDDPRHIDWWASVVNFIQYTAGRGVDPGLIERQVVLRPHRDTKEIGRDVRVRQLRLR